MKDVDGFPEAEKQSLREVASLAMSWVRTGGSCLPFRRPYSRYRHLDLGEAPGTPSRGAGAGSALCCEQVVTCCPIAGLSSARGANAGMFPGPAERSSEAAFGGAGRPRTSFACGAPSALHVDLGRVLLCSGIKGSPVFPTVPTVSLPGARGSQTSSYTEGHTTALRLSVFECRLIIKHRVKVCSFVFL